VGSMTSGKPPEANSLAKPCPYGSDPQEEME
jgi:hypothetical protein